MDIDTSPSITVGLATVAAKGLAQNLKQVVDNFFVGVQVLLDASLVLTLQSLLNSTAFTTGTLNFASSRSSIGNAIATAGILTAIGIATLMASLGDA
jgi:hypothetical protein